MGSQGWARYVESVSDSQTLLVKSRPADPVGGLVSGIFKIKTCQIAYNARVNQAGTLDAEEIKVVEESNRQSGERSFKYTNSRDNNLCGAITSADGSQSWKGDLVDAGAAATASVVTGVTNGIGLLLAPKLFKFANDIKKEMRGPLLESVTEGGYVMNLAQLFACQYVGTHFTAGDGGNPVNAVNGCSQPDSPEVPGIERHQVAMKRLTQLLGDNTKKIEDKLKSYTQDSAQMVEDAKVRGWAGMGSWFYEISALNRLLTDTQKVDAFFVPGTLWGQEDADIKGSVVADVDKKVIEILARYDDWWKNGTAVQGVDPVSDASAAAAGVRKQDIFSSSVKKDDVKDWLKMSNDSGVEKMVDAIAGKAFPQSLFVFGPFDENFNDITYPMSKVAQIGDTIRDAGLTIIGVHTAIQILSGVSAFGFSLGGYVGSALSNGLNTVAFMMITCGVMLSYYLPVLPLIRVAFAVLTWMISVFEAVVMVPIAALTFLNADGEGMGSKHVWILWLNVLLRPMFVVLGYVGAMLVYNAFAVYFNLVFASGVKSMMNDRSGLGKIIGLVSYSIIYVSVLYTAINTVFKMLDMIPNHFMRWIGGPSPDASFDQDNTAEMMMAGTNLARGFAPTGRGGGGKGGGKGDDDKSGVTKSKKGKKGKK